MNITFFRPYIRDYLDGTHMTLETGRTCVTNDKIHAEIKPWNKWMNGIGNLLAYNHAAHRDELHIYLFGRPLENKTTHIQTIIKMNMKPFEIIINLNKINIIDLTNNQIVHIVDL